MLTIKQIRENKAFTLERLAVKGVDAKETVDRIEALDDERKSLQGELDACLAQQNAIAKEVGQLFKQGKKEEAEAAKAVTSNQGWSFKSSAKRCPTMPVAPIMPTLNFFMILYSP